MVPTKTRRSETGRESGDSDEQMEKNRCVFAGSVSDRRAVDAGPDKSGGSHRLHAGRTSRRYRRDFAVGKE